MNIGDVVKHTQWKNWVGIITRVLPNRTFLVLYKDKKEYLIHRFELTLVWSPDTSIDNAGN